MTTSFKLFWESYNSPRYLPGLSQTAVGVPLDIDSASENVSWVHANISSGTALTFRASGAPAVISALVHSSLQWEMLVYDTSYSYRDGLSHIRHPGRSTLERRMANVLVLYYSSYGHVETMAYAVAEGA